MVSAADVPPAPWFRRRLSIRPPKRPAADPTAERRAALARLAALTALDADVRGATRTRLLEPAGHTDVTVIIWHGFTNAPTQFLAVAEQLRASGYRVLLPRMPHHGRADLLTKDLATLTADELVAHVHGCIDIAAGLGERTWVVGLSAGGTLAALAATRAEVSRAVLLAPLIAPKGFPMAAVRLCVKFPRLVPSYYMWWDPRVKERLGHSPHAYPGFPLPGVVPFLNLAESMLDGGIAVTHRLERTVLITNPHDLAVRQDAARAFALTVFSGVSDYFSMASLDDSLQWTHDFVDPWSPNGGTIEQVTGIVRAGLGVGEPYAGGVLDSSLADSAADSGEAAQPPPP